MHDLVKIVGNVIFAPKHSHAELEK